MNSKKDINELADIGHKIANVFQDVRLSIEANGLTDEDLEAFEDYLAGQDSTMSIFNPTFFINGGDTMIKLARDKVRILREFYKYQEGVRRELR